MPKQTFFNLPEEKRQALVDLAIEEFAANDYDAASISRIVARAGIAKGSLYQYFADKADLYQYLLGLAGEKKAEFMAANPPAPEMDLFTYMRWLFRQGVGFELAHPRLAQLGYRAVYGKSPLPETLLEAARSATLSYFQGLIEASVRRGDLDPGIDANLAAFVFNAVFNDLGRYMATRAGEQPGGMPASGHYPLESPEVQFVFDRLIDMLKNGMAVKKDAGRRLEA
jgi:AcrR family transcriptional regulator